MRGEKLLDIDAEFKAACSAVDRRALVWMLDQGIPYTALYSDFLQTGFTRTFGVAAIEVLRDNSWVFTVDSRKAIIVHVGQDLVAFFPNAPDMMYRRLNYQAIAGDDALTPIWPTSEQEWAARAKVLGEKPEDWTEAEWLEVCNQPAELDDPRVWVHENVLEWMRAGFDGIVILDWKANLPALLNMPAGFRVRRDAFATRLYNAITRPYPAPRIFVTE